MLNFVKNFTPNWFTVGMGTGITALGAYLYPGGPLWLKEAGTGLWLVNVVIVGILLVMMVLKWIVNWKGSIALLHDPIQSMFLGAVPMALTTVINGFIDMGSRLIGHTAIAIGFSLWVINVMMALASGIVVPFMMFISHDHRLDKMTGIWLMPVVPAEVAAASGSLIIPHLAHTATAQTMMVINLGLWALSVPLAFLMLGFLFLRLAVHKLPPAEMAISTWISLGTLGTGIMGLIGLGKSLPLLFGSLGHAMDGAAVLGSFALWGFGLWWLALSILLTVVHARRGLPFNLGWWGLTFPLGVFTGGTDMLYGQMHVGLIAFFAHLFFVMLALFWAMVALRTFRAVLTGRLTFSGAPKKVVLHETRAVN
ncbi:MAG: C4-dicarboxylate ABC transporter [Sulfobacillus thermosulfidooxidans]|uniref:C4-dicarboxylate ABC transporter n=1 Tax=Sulfobacillus thermotolerans TaxID=338644 RepID=A0ABM6RPG4_9FIRM|nr:TDT family transporter [Sulfobacillus sp. hq2]AUW93259.1 C4-dicarboxylate ABC transporter [Sulfobacillus thermotolerans]MCY0906912.1 TDT family transporter [Sulfobacillus thermotolerans]POB11661.1 C4-dicarboxylate ABC transporter [Sulfobacillus sp. hq2]PSR36387.1 MAG: C4-dicarboxylate ABC transporter [Sulfobacillus thermosulfidooxidans]